MPKIIRFTDSRDSERRSIVGWMELEVGIFQVLTGSITPRPRNARNSVARVPRTRRCRFAPSFSIEWIALLVHACRGADVRAQWERPSRLTHLDEVHRTSHLSGKPGFGVTPSLSIRRLEATSASEREGAGQEFPAKHPYEQLSCTVLPRAQSIALVSKQRPSMEKCPCPTKTTSLRRCAKRLTRPQARPGSAGLASLRVSSPGRSPPRRSTLSLVLPCVWLVAPPLVP